MSTIRCLYEEEPNFQATDQHPDSVRYAINVGVYRFVDAIGGQPTQAEIDAVLNPASKPDNGAALDKSRTDKIHKQLTDAINAGDTPAALRLMQSLLPKGT